MQILHLVVNWLINRFLLLAAVLRVESKRYENNCWKYVTVPATVQRCVVINCLQILRLIYTAMKRTVCLKTRN